MQHRPARLELPARVAQLAKSHLSIEQAVLLAQVVRQAPVVGAGRAMMAGRPPSISHSVSHALHIRQVPMVSVKYAKMVQSLACCSSRALPAGLGLLAQLEFAGNVDLGSGQTSTQQYASCVQPLQTMLIVTKGVSVCSAVRAANQTREDLTAHFWQKHPNVTIARTQFCLAAP